MACVENWTTVESLNGDDLELTITTPNDCWTCSGVDYSLPPGMSTEDLCNYEEGDLILVANMVKSGGCGPSDPPGTVTALSHFRKVSEGGNHVQIIVYKTATSEASTIKRSRNKYN